MEKSRRRRGSGERESKRSRKEKGERGGEDVELVFESVGEKRVEPPERPGREPESALLFQLQSTHTTRTRNHKKKEKRGGGGEMIFIKNNIIIKEEVQRSQQEEEDASEKGKPGENNHYCSRMSSTNLPSLPPLLFSLGQRREKKKK